MTREAATKLAHAMAAEFNEPIDLWHHVGGESPGGYISPQGRWLPRRQGTPAPRWAWAKHGMIQPGGERGEDLSV